MVTKSSLGVGLIGVQPGRSWAAVAHVPALQALGGDFHIAGIANTSRPSAQRAVDALGVGHAFASADELVESPDVDVVAVTVKVPHHYELVMAALRAGKHVYCEWPLGNGLNEAREMAALAREKGVVAVAGTQARVAPGMLHLRELVSSGYVGEVLSSTLIGTGMRWGPTITEANAYLLDAESGANMLTIPFGHTLAAVVDVLGDVASVSAILATRRQTVRIEETGEEKRMTVPDQVLVAALLESGAPISIHYRGGTPRGTGLLWEINGTDGDLQVAGVNGHTQMVDLVIRGARGPDRMLSDLPLPDSLLGIPGLDIRVGNVARVYARLAADVRNGTRTAPTFDDAVRSHELIAAVEESARLGRRVAISEIR